MGITIELEPDAEARLRRNAARYNKSVSEYLNILLLEAPEPPETEDKEDYQAFVSNPQIAAGLEEARKRIQAAIEADPEFARSISGPLSDDAEIDEVLKAAYSRHFGSEVFEEHYGKELAELFRRQIGD